MHTSNNQDHPARQKEQGVCAAVKQEQAHPGGYGNTEDWIDASGTDSKQNEQGGASWGYQQKSKCNSNNNGAN
jgi:hypothetical protein